jgi:hypothetical protein
MAPYRILVNPLYFRSCRWAPRRKWSLPGVVLVALLAVFFNPPDETVRAMASQGGPSLPESRTAKEKSLSGFC